MIRPLLTRAAFALTLMAAAVGMAGPPRIEITLDPAVNDQPYTGRVYVMTTRSERRSPMNGPNWFGCEPFFGLDVTDLKPGDTLVFDAASCLGHPCSLGDLPAGTHRVQAVIDRNGWSHDVIRAPGNVHSDVVVLEHDPGAPGTVRLTLNRTVPAYTLDDRDDLKYVRVSSRLLSGFHRREVFLQAAVGLPESYGEEPERRFPVVYVIDGFGSSISRGAAMANPRLYSEEGVEFVVVYLDADCPLGHHVWADSVNNGPWGQALIEELIPHLEKTFRLIPETTARFVTGHSSGGWSSLWLQVTYPDTFGGCWSTSPDPVDFTAFQTLDIYDPQLNFYTMPDGSPRPVARMGGRSGKPLTNREFDAMEQVLGRGGQLASFEAVFSPRGPDGKPARLWDRSTGRLDPAVAKAWKKYDIRMILEQNWSTLGPKLNGKLHLVCGDQDTFYLEGAFLKLRDALRRLGSDATVEVIPGAGHGLPRRVFRDAAEQMARAFLDSAARSNTTR